MAQKHPEASAKSRKAPAKVDVCLVGGGIMSATLGLLLQHMKPDWSIVCYERASSVATESSNAWNNAGTGHAALCELNYTPENPDGSIQTSRALKVNSQFHESREFWSHLVTTGLLEDPSGFIRSIPHMSYVTGDKDVDFLRRRYEALKPFAQFSSLELSSDPAALEQWVPLMMRDRDESIPLAMTKTDQGTDVNFGRLTKLLFEVMVSKGAKLCTRHDVCGLEQLLDGSWRVEVKNRDDGSKFKVDARFVFVGAGGRAIHLLQKSGIREAKGYGGFPVSGQFLRCTNPELIKLHAAKVYGKPQVNAPPMSMPHLDRRVVEGRQDLLFGPYAGFSPKYLKAGSILDLIKSLRSDNILTMLTVAKDEMPLTLYLIGQVMQKHASRIGVLRDFVPDAAPVDWELIHAGMRVQTMKRTAAKRGVLEFGTEVVAARDGTIAGLLGASPGASTAVSIMIDVIKRCFPDEYQVWLPKLRDIIPTHGVDLTNNARLVDETVTATSQALGLQS